MNVDKLTSTLWLSPQNNGKFGYWTSILGSSERPGEDNSEDRNADDNGFQWHTNSPIVAKYVASRTQNDRVILVTDRSEENCIAKLFGWQPSRQQSHVDGTGNALKNDIYGGSGNNSLWGMNGDDQINGGDGDNVMFGGNGNDRFNGNNGNDLFYGGAGTDRFDGGAGTMCSIAAWVRTG
jgi:Ca2+-binding RTX toxin-like protein